MLTKSLAGITPHKAWTGLRPDYSYICKIGCKVFVIILASHNPKIYACSIECILISYAINSKAYKYYDKQTDKIYETYHVKFCKSHDGHPYSPASHLSNIAKDKHITENQQND